MHIMQIAVLNTVIRNSMAVTIWVISRGLVSIIEMCSSIDERVVQHQL
jgi:hypothetical protein